MNWKIDNILFSNYGVTVESTSGVLDLPRLEIDQVDWLDEDGIDVRETVKKKDHEISLKCWIKGNSFADFKNKVQVFWEALTSPDMRVLSSDYIPGGIDVYVHKSINVSRAVGWVQEKQIGRFNLRLTVPGDPDYYLLDIKREFDYNVVATVKTDNLKVYKTLQGDVYAQCSFETGVKIDFKFFDHIRLMTNGSNMDLFHVESEPIFKKVSTNRYVYTVRFEHQINWLLHARFLNDRNEADFYFHANAAEIVELIVANHNREWWDNFLVGSIADTERRYHKFNNETCADVLRRVCAEYNLEFEFEYIGPSKYAINVKESVANSTGVLLQYGKENGLIELSRERALTDELCTILYAFGSSKNLKPEYRNGIGRLSFDANPIRSNDNLNTGWGPREHVEYFDDIFPSRTAQVTDYVHVLPEDLPDNELEVFPEGKFIVFDGSLDFDINEYLLGGLTAKIKMKTGDLAGYEFEIARYDNLTKAIYIIPFKDERGKIWPNETMSIAATDEYTLIDIDQPPIYVTEAENKLALAAADYLAKYSVLRFVYRCKVDTQFLIDNDITGFDVGDKINIIDSDYNINDEFRISRLTYDVYSGEYDLELSDSAHLTKKQKDELRLAALERTVQDVKLDEVPSMRKNKRSVDELRNELLDPVDDKLNADRNVRDESLDPRMLAYDAGVPQFYLEDALVECNVDDDEDFVRVHPGKITMTNFKEKTLTRYEIKKLKEDNIVYDPTRTWIIQQTDFNLTTKGGYWIYAKLDMSENSTICVLEIYPEHVEVKSKVELNFLYYKLGHISKGEELS